ncbi:MAG: cytidine deaminase [Bacteroidetes bacterium]|nr:cytidine deaminase [Bacteroidota bacterium]
MDLIKKELIIQRYANVAELVEADQRLLEEAKQALLTAYAPYSKFYVGCALLMENGKIIRGSNQENIAFPSGLCAERVAIFHAGSEYPDMPILAMAITVKATNFIVASPAMSCGACLQSISEYETRQQQQIRSILQGETGDIYIAEQGTLAFLPFQFKMEVLKR